MKKAGIQTRPVPAPRRLNPEMRAGNYENIEINVSRANSSKNNTINVNTNHTQNSTRNDLNISTDKKLNIDAENFHKSCEEKKLPTSSHVKVILQSKNLEQPIYGPDANEVVLTELLYATPKPAPRQRASPKLLPEEETKQANLAEALSRPLRVAPQVPFSSLNIEIDCGNSERSRICSERSSNNGQLVDDSPFNVSVDFSESAQGSKLKSLSPGYVGFDEEFRGHEQDLNCDSEMDTEAVAKGVARSNQSEQSGSSNDSRNLLRSLGNTSKQIGGSIGERMASKAKGAKTRLDNNLRNSTEAICSLSADASHRLRLVGKRLGANFTLGKQENKTTELGALPGLDQETEQERRRTMPSSDIFNTIQFSSPLNHSAAVGYYTDLSDHRELSHGLPEPKPNSLSQLKAKPPSYDEALRSRSSPSLPPAKKPLDASAQNLQLQNHYHHHHQQERQCSSEDSPYREPIIPTHPPPLLFQQLDALLPPSHQERRKKYENIRQFPLNVELQKLNRVPASPKSEQSLLNSTKIAEAQIYKPEIPDSWHFYSDAAAEREPHPTASPGVKVECDFSFFPESVYANQEATYIKLFEIATSSTSDDKLLTSQLDPACVKEDGELNSYDGAVGGWSASLAHTMPPPLELIEEFDPLMRKSLTLSRSNKSNELLLLEHLLEEDTYGVIKRDQDDLSMCASEENERIDAAAASTLTEIKNINKSGIKNNVQIVHQNAQLLGDSMENILNEAHPLDLDTIDLQSWPRHSRMEKNLGKPFVDLATPSRNRTNWFVGDKVQIEGDSPPTYLEAIGGDAQPVTSASLATPLAASANSESLETRSKLGSRFRQTMNAFSNVKMRMDAMRTSFKGGAQRQADEKVALQMVPRPCLSPLLVRYEGSLVRFPSGVVEDILKEMQNRKVVLRDRHFQTFVDQEMRTPKETIPLDSITTVQCVSNSRITDSATHFYCFEMTTSLPKNSSAVGIESTSSNPNVLLTSYSNVNFKQQRVAYLYGVGKESERGIWMQKILESLTNIVPVKYTCHFYRAGWCYLKNSISSEWSGTWLVLRKNQRRLIFVSESNGNVEKMDLRKARCIVLKESDESTDNLYVERGPMLMIDCPPYTVYTIMSSARETKIWRHIIREVAHNNGFSLSDQQLTRYDVPVIVDKCINFVYIHGSMSEGIYRKSGSENSMQKLISAFRADAFNVEITRNEYNEHDVANVLKRFMRDLPERLLGKLTDSFVFVTELAVASEKIPIYKELLSRLSFIERETLRRIVSHLVFISSQQARNKMSVQNLAIIWGPTLLAKKCDELVYSQKEADVLSDLIVLYTNLFPCSADETKKEKAMLMCLQKYYAAAETLKDAVKQSGDIKMWISLNPNPNITTEEKTQVNATISPTKTAYELCREYSEKMQKPSHELTLYEVILNDSLERPLHHDAKVFEVILNWSYWPEEDRKHNYLVVRPIEMLRDVQKAVNNLGTVTPSKELRFADYRTKTFKTLQCELRDGKIIVSKKDKLEKTTIVREIFLHSCTAYLGCERKRDFSLSWAITFVERTQSQIMRSRDAPFIGHVLAGREWVDRTIWYSSIWYCLHGDHILPPVDVILS